MRKAVTHLKKSDPVMRAIIERLGPCRMQFGRPEFHSLAEAIVYQQLNGKAAETIFKRFAALAGEPLTPAGILKLSDEQMRGAGLSKQKTAYLKDLAAKTSSGLVDFGRLPDLPDAEVVEHLIQVKGIGVWTAQMFLMFTLKRENVLPTGDFGVRMAQGRVASARSSCPVRNRWRRSRNAGSLTAAWPAGICGRVSIRKPFNQGTERDGCAPGGRCV